MNLYLQGILWVIGAGLLASALLYLLQRYGSAELRAQHNDVTGAVYTNLGVLYAVMLAFIVIAVWDSLGEAERTSYAEANDLVEVYWAGQHAPAPQGPKIKELSRQYAMTVTEAEWPKMARGEATGPEGWAVLDQLRTQVESLKSEDATVQARYDSAVAKVVSLIENRQSRLDAGGGLTPVVWLVLIGGGMLFIAFAFLFGVPSRIGHQILVVTITMMVVMLLFAVYQLEDPYSRSGAVGPEGMRFALSRFTQIG
ncbi:DUF4239 domain-containing protein [Longispora albida]|uniref:bestrophin-like domain n=1 Tax=Longispora albida TaxID=203523 RepID=UPI000382E650|nr:DUF4239 domain-containing protein [Longispora albida]